MHGRHIPLVEILVHLLAQALLLPSHLLLLSFLQRHVPLLGVVILRCEDGHRGTPSELGEELHEEYLRELEEEAETNKDDEVTAPKVGDVEAITDTDVVAAAHDRLPGNSAVQSADLIWPNVCRVLVQTWRVAGYDGVAVARELNAVRQSLSNG